MAAARSRLAEAYLVVPREHGSLGVLRATYDQKSWDVLVRRVLVDRSPWDLLVAGLSVPVGRGACLARPPHAPG
jgi:hypothetical protein